MKWIQPSVAAGETLSGTWLASGSSVLAEIAARAGFDWALLDMEHGLGDWGELRQMLQAIGGTGCAPIVRVGAMDAYLIKRALDFGASGIMAPMVSTAEQAADIVAAMRYPPQGIRGMASGSRAAGYGMDFADYFSHANERLLTVCQIETAQGVANAEAIAAVDGVDVLFVGPSDLSLSLGHYRQFDHPAFQGSLDRVIASCRNAGTHCGVLLSSPDAVPEAVAKGMTFIALGVDTALYRDALKTSRAAFAGSTE